jgi:hypothetical protein
MDLPKECQGCTSYIEASSGTFCVVTSISTILSFSKVCPCKTCLLKCMCYSRIRKHSKIQGVPYCELFLEASRNSRGLIAYG